MPAVMIIGMGLCVNDLTESHWQSIRSADILMGGRRHLAQLENVPVRKEIITADISKTLDFIQKHMTARRIVVLASGDPLYYGLGARLVQALGPENITVQTNISSIAAAFARLKIAWDGARVISLHGRDNWSVLLNALKSPNPVAVMTDGRRSPDWVAGQLLAMGLRHLQMAVLERLGTIEEKIQWYSLAEAAGQTFQQPNVLVLSPPDNAANRYPELCLGMPEASFVHQEGLITKSEVRAVSIAKLQLQPGLTLWDLGAGSGAVGIEAAVLLGDGWIVAVEKHALRVSQIRDNASRFGVYNLEVVEGVLPQVVESLPAPDRVFIGGGGRSLASIITAAVQRLRPGGIIVANTVLLANLQATIAVMEACHLITDVVQVQISRGKTMPWSQRFEAQNPVWIIQGRMV